MPSYVRDRDSPRPRDRDKHKSRRSPHKTSTKDHVTTPSIPARSATLASPTTKRTTSMPLPELQRRASSGSPRESRTSLPYPSFSKAHSKEAVGSREDVIKPRPNLYTPDPTDLDRRKQDQKNGEVQSAAPGATTAPPLSPPLTAVEPVVEVEGGNTGDQKEATDDTKIKPVNEKDVADAEERTGRRSQTSASKKSFWRLSKDEGRSTMSSSWRPKSSTPVKMKPKPATVDDASSLTNHPRSTSPTRASTVRTGTDSDATSRAPNQAQSRQPFSPDADDESSPTTDPDSSPRTPTVRDPHFPPSRKVTPAFSIFPDRGQSPGVEDSPMPPPPPPPPTMPFQAPRVDYLMQNGGLPQSVPRTLLGVVHPVSTNPAYQPQPISSTAAQVEKFFAPFNGLLDDYTKVVSKNGSLAVATGYKSIARRLLDRLEAVFARDISSEVCGCVMCHTSPTDNRDTDDQRGVSWGEILEYVCGRKELPPWPAFTLDAAAVGLGISATETRLPMQQLDIDVPEEYREHYTRQSKKTKQSVDRWLASQPDNPSSPPQDVDDETLTFAMLTHLEPEQRPIFSALLGVAPSRPASRVNAPITKPVSNLMTSSGPAIQRLYRLAYPPRDPETAIYMLNNPSMHNVLATLAAISDAEWSLLISGRFDGFLRSGADNPHTTTASPSTSRLPSRRPTPSTMAPFRGTTPFSRAPTPASVGAPVALDEETEIAVLAEIEREIYLGMEALEDAFEALHVKAEGVRQALRERGAGLTVACQARTGSGEVEARLGTPSSQLGGAGGRGWDSETDDGIDEAASELGPDDSASNVSGGRVRRTRRGGRGRERWTPAAVEEEEEDEDDGGVGGG